MVREASGTGTLVNKGLNLKTHHHFVFGYGQAVDLFDKIRTIPDEGWYFVGVRGQDPAHISGYMVRS